MCDVEEDPFVFMQDNNKVYGFTMALHEFERTIPTLWKTTMGKHCHFWGLLQLSTFQTSSRQTAGISLEIMRWGFYLMMTEIHITFVTVSTLDSCRLVLILSCQSGAILRLRIWISGAQRHTLNTLTISNPQAGSTMRCVYHSTTVVCLTSSSAMGIFSSTFISGSTFRSERPDTLLWGNWLPTSSIPTLPSGRTPYKRKMLVQWKWQLWLSRVRIILNSLLSRSKAESMLMESKLVGRVKSNLTGSSQKAVKVRRRFASITTDLFASYSSARRM